MLFDSVYLRNHTSYDYDFLAHMSNMMISAVIFIFSKF